MEGEVVTQIMSSTPPAAAIFNTFIIIANLDSLWLHRDQPKKLRIEMMRYTNRGLQRGGSRARKSNGLEILRNEELKEEGSKSAGEREETASGKAEAEGKNRKPNGRRPDTQRGGCVKIRYVRLLPLRLNWMFAVIQPP